MGVCAYTGAEGLSVWGGAGLAFAHLFESPNPKVGCAVVLKAQSIKSTEQSPLGLGQSP